MQLPPVTLAYLAAITREEGHHPAILDCPASSISLARLLRSLRTLRPDFCVVAISTPSFRADMHLVEAVKEAVPGTVVAVLGVHATAMDREILEEYGDVDYVIRNEPEETFRDLLHALAAGSGPGNVKGLTFRCRGSHRRNPNRPFLAELDSLPLPAWDTLDLSRYRLPFSPHRFLIVVPQRGCPFHCTFCTAGLYYGRTVRLRSVDAIIGEIHRNRRRFAVNDFFMWAETFTLDRDFVLDLTRSMRREVSGIRWTCNSRTDTVDEELLRSMRAAGCWMVSFGIESTSDEVLKGTGKNLRSKDMDTPIRLARRAGIRTLGHFILGLPGDTPASIENTIRQALALDLDFVQFYTAAPFAGSALHQQAKEKGRFDHTDFTAISQTRASIELDDLPPAVIDRARRSAIRRFYFRPRQLARLFRTAGFGLPRQLLREVVRRGRNRRP